MLLAAIEERVLPISSEVATRCARFHVPDRGSEPDSWIAATVLVHGLAIITRNVADFTRTGANLVNPWTST
jgi:predicted nucleic acid-binding protein